MGRSPKKIASAASNFSRALAPELATAQTWPTGQLHEGKVEKTFGKAMENPWNHRKPLKKKWENGALMGFHGENHRKTIRKMVISMEKSMISFDLRDLFDRKAEKRDFTD